MKMVEAEKKAYHFQWSIQWHHNNISWSGKTSSEWGFIKFNTKFIVVIWIWIPQKLVSLGPQIKF